jgi:hypothetical protein
MCSRPGKFFSSSTAIAAVAAAWPVLVPAAAAAATGQKLSPTTSPSARAGSAMAYDPVSGRVVLFDGFSASNYHTETWTGSNGVQLQTAKTLPARMSLGMAYDAASHQLLIFGEVEGSPIFNYTGKFMAH